VISSCAERIQEGYVQTTWGPMYGYLKVGSKDTTPLLTLHGGPGFPHDCLESLKALADERPIIFYDQLGCGRSDRPNDVPLWRIERFVEELIQIRDALAPDRVHILGHSWGSMLATDYALTQPAGLVSLILASPPLSIPRWLKDLAEYRHKLPKDVQQTLDRHEKAGTTDSDEYETATNEFYKRHICRSDPWPEALERTIAGGEATVYQTMWGPNEFFMTGNLQSYDRTGSLSEVRVPTLFTCGAYDEATPEATAWYHSLVADSESVVFENSAHMPHLEEPEHYVRVLRDFLAQVDQR